MNFMGLNLKCDVRFCIDAVRECIKFPFAILRFIYTFK